MSQLVSAFEHDPTIDLVDKVGECAMAYPEDRPIIVGVAGGSGSGKTTIAKHLLDSLGAEQITYIPHDKYVTFFNQLAVFWFALSCHVHRSTTFTNTSLYLLLLMICRVPLTHSAITKI